MRVIAAQVVPMQPPTLSSLKALLWADVLTKATRQIGTATVGYRARVDVDTLGFWEFLDRLAGDRSYSGLGVVDLALLYHRYRCQPWQPRRSSLTPYAEAAAAGWTHPASQRALHLLAHYVRLLHVEGFLATSVAVDDAVIRLAEGSSPEHIHTEPVAGNRTGHIAEDILTDIVTRRDDTRRLEQTLPAHVARALTEAAPAIRQAEPMVILHDTRFTHDYRAVERVLRGRTPAVHLLGLSAVRDDLPGGDQTPSMFDLDEVLARAGQAYGAAATRLGLRLYFLAVLGRNEHHRFQPERLYRWISRADRMLGQAENTAADLTPALARNARRGYVCPYMLTSDVLSRRPMPRKEILAVVYT